MSRTPATHSAAGRQLRLQGRARRMAAALLLTLAAAVPAGAAGAAGAAATRAATGDLDFRVERLAGATRYSTAVALSRQFGTTPAPVVVVSTGEDFPDALAAGPAAAHLGGSSLFVRAGAVPTETRAELVRLQAQRIVVLGGAGAVSEDVRRELAALSSGGATRIEGSDRYATAAAVSAATFGPGPAVAYVASGETFADALSAGAAAARADGPLLLVRAGEVPAQVGAELARLRPQSIVIVGSTAVVSSAVEASLGRYAPAVTRLAGADRYATAAAVSRAVVPAGGAGVLLTTGTAFPDGLAAGAHARRAGGPVLLVRSDGVPAVTAAELLRLRPKTAFVVGGPAAVGAAVLERAQALLGVCWSGTKPSGGTPRIVSSVPGATGRVALTFDMGGRMTPALSIMNFLVDSQVCTTLFPTGAISQTAEGTAALAVAAAHPELFEIGNHTMHHCNLRDGGGGSPTTAPCPPARPTATFVAGEITSAVPVITTRGGKGTSPYWRPPYGAYDSVLTGVVAGTGHTVTLLWDVDPIDWRPVAEGGPTAQQIVDKVVGRAVSGSIVLMHLGGWNTREALPAMVAGLRARGLTPTTISELFAATAAPAPGGLRRPEGSGRPASR